MTGLQCANQTRPVPSDGIARSGVRYDPASYRAGYVAGLVGRANIAPREIRDPLAWHIVVMEERDMIEEEKVTWTASNNSSYLVGEREASTVLAAVRAARSYIRYELYGEGKATISVNGVPVRADERSIFTGFRWVVTDLTE
jgi:hypothetical protein